MYKGISYNVEFKPRTKKSKYNMEFGATHDFLASDYENVCLEYNDKREVKNAYQAIYAYTQKARQPLKVSTRGNCIVITKEVKE